MDIDHNNEVELLNALKAGDLAKVNDLLSQGYKFVSYTWDGRRLKNLSGRVLYDFTETKPISEDEDDECVDIWDNNFDNWEKWEDEDNSPYPSMG